MVRVRVRVRGGGSKLASGLRLEGSVCSILTVMLDGLGRRDSGINLDPKTQIHQCAHSVVRQ